MGHYFLDILYKELNIPCIETYQKKIKDKLTLNDQFSLINKS